MKPLDQVLTKIATEHLNIATLKPWMSDGLDSHNVAAWQVAAALKAAFDAGLRYADKNVASPRLAARRTLCCTVPRGELHRRSHREGNMTAPEYSPAPWTYDYNPYTIQSEHHPLGAGAEIPAFEIWDAGYNKVFDTNEDTPSELQEANARMAASAPTLLASLVKCASLLADNDESDGPEGEAYREALAAITEATGRPA